MEKIIINKEQARTFVLECFESIINDIRAKENQTKIENNGDETPTKIA